MNRIEHSLVVPYQLKWLLLLLQYNVCMVLCGIIYVQFMCNLTKVLPRPLTVTLFIEELCFSLYTPAMNNS